KALYFCICLTEELAVPLALYKLFVRKGHKVDAPETNKFILGEFQKPIRKGVEYGVAGCLDTMCNDDLLLPQQGFGQEVDKDSKQRALTGAFCSGNKVNAVIQQVGERGGFDSSSFKKCI